MNDRSCLACCLLFVSSLFTLPATADSAVTLRGRIVDDADGKPVPARLYIHSAEQKWHHARSSSAQGSAVEYSKIRDSSQEVHTTMSAHPFEADLPPGRYTLTVERGKEYHTLERQIEITADAKSKPVEVELSIRRWTTMADRGWYSGDTHVHRTMAELPNAVVAEDLNVALPLTYWVTDSTETPAKNNKNRETIPPAKLIRVDDTHVIWPINTEYEIFTVRRERHTLGALFVLNHTKPLEVTAPTVGPIVQQAREQNEHIVLDLDKHNWPWSMMLPPVARVDLFELTNNHIWRTDFRFTTWYPEYAAKYMNIEMDSSGGFTERGWIDFGFKTYYALLNCGLPMQPTGGTASGVHPVPLGFGRVYVELSDGLDYDAWIHGLKKGRSFVTTGPMLTATFNGQPHGSVFRDVADEKLRITGTAESVYPVNNIEVIVNGQVERTLVTSSKKTKQDGYLAEFETMISVDQSSWIALRCFEDRPDKRPRFAHTSPVHIQVADRPLKPRKEELDYLIKRVADELQRHEGVLSKEALAEFNEALDYYKNLQRAD